MKGFNCKRWISLMLAAVLCLVCLPVVGLDVRASSDDFAGGSGTEADPYLIKTKYHLNHVRNDLAAHYKMIADIEFTEADFAEGGDFYNDGEGWSPIGDKDTPFSGIFDGNGHTITGLKINYLSQGKIYIGLIGYQNGGVIKNLGMIDSEINVSATSAYINKPMSGHYADAHVGGVVGYASGSTITGCYNTGNITVQAVAAVGSSLTDTYGRSYAGGIVGYASGTTISDCYNTGIITADKTSGSSGSYCYAYAYAGGVVGYAYNATVTGCYNIGSITAKTIAGSFDADAYPYAYSDAGGIVGNSSETTITDCYNSGSITTVSESSVVSSAGKPYIYIDAGGISGAGGTITNCYNTGSVRAEAHAPAYPGEAYAHAGGISGIFGNALTECYNAGSVAAEATAYHSGRSAYAYAYSGGIAGYIYGNTLSILDCYNTGDVTAGAEATMANGSNLYGSTAYSYSGGIMGYASDATITSSYNTGSTTGTAAAQSPYGCYAYKRVYIGGIAGFASEDTSIIDGYYLNIVPIGVASGKDAGTACTAEQMKQQSTFTGFDFSSVWTMNGDEDYLLPRLHGMPMVKIHQYTSYISNNDATCTTDGTKTAICDYCDQTDTVSDDGSAKGHDYADAACTTPKICKVCGDTDGNAVGHSWIDATSDAPKTCKVCGATEGTALLKPAPEVPYKITNVVSGVHVYWKAVDGISKYGLWRSETGKDGTYKWVGNPTVAHFTDTKVESGKTYWYKVTTLDTATNTHSDKSEAVGITYVGTPDINLRVNRAAGIGLRWDKIEGATGYAIYRKSYYGTDAWARVATVEGGDNLSWDDTSVKNANGEVYRYTIRALAGSNMKTLSGCRSTGRTMVRLTSRTLTSAERTGDGSIKCTWSTTSQATGYEVRFMVGSTVYKTYTIGNYKTGTKTFTGLTSGQTYKIQVRSYKKVDGVGSFYSAWSTAKNVTLK